MPLVRVEISHLFGQIDHQLKIDTATRLTVFTAPNGYGKTVLLNLIDAFYRGDLPFILSVDFKQLEFIFEQQSVHFNKLDEQRLSISHKIGNKTSGEQQLFDINDFSDGFNPKELDQIYQTIATTAQSQMDIWGNNDFAQQCHEASVNQHPEAVRWNKQLYSHEIKALLKNQPVNLISSQRFHLTTQNETDLFNCNNETTLIAIEKCAIDLASEFSAHQQNYEQTAKELDATLPNRLLAQDQSCELEPKILHKQYKNLYKTRIELESIGLLQPQVPPLPAPADINQADVKLIDLLVKDLRTKLNLFQSLMNKVDLFIMMVNQNLSFKSLALCPQNGFKVVCDNNKTIKLGILSSGEQQLIILSYQIAMSMQEHLLLLIDEPEAGISSQWQTNLLNTFKQLIKDFNTNIIIATQSAHIIDNQDNLIIKRCESCGHLH